MNQERILELANKANENIGYTFKLEDAKQIHELMEKFAELLIEELIEEILFRASMRGEFCTRTKLIEEIKNHFGVEE